MESGKLGLKRGRPSRVAARAARLLFAAYLAGAGLLLIPLPAAAQSEIASDGPLTRIIVTPDLNCQVAYRGDAAFEFFPGSSETGACGTFVAVDGTLFGPAEVPSASLFGRLTPWAPVNQAAPAGSGTAQDPFRVVTVVDAAETSLRLEQTDSYVVGSQAYRTDLSISNLGQAARTLTVYRAADCFLQESDRGYGRVDGGAPACVTSLEAGSRIEQWVPLTEGSRYFEGSFGEVWSIIAAQQPFPNRCDCELLLDNGAGLSWTVQVAAGGSVAISHDTFFSPVGRAGIQQPLRQSVPDPLSISLDPVVVAQSVAIAAGVVLLVPFPSALFNNTLEANYERVMAGVGRANARLAAGGRALAFRARGAWAARRAAPSSAVPTAGADLPGGATAGGLPLETEPGAELAPSAIAAPTEASAPVPPVVAAPATGADADPAEVAARPATDFWRTPLGLLAFVLLSALLYLFLDPTLGIGADTLATFAGLAAGLAVIVLARWLPLLFFARSRGIGLVARALPATLVVGVACVLLSRLADFQPGYLYGLIVGFLFARGLGADEGKVEAIAAGVLLATAGAAWLLLALLRAADTVGASLFDVALETAAVTVVVAGFEAAVFSMLPLRFMPGGVVYAWNRRVWAVLLGVGTLAFAHVLLNPSTGYMADATRGSFLTMVVLVAGFAIFSAAFWAWFRFRPTPMAPAAAE
ncbi:MAG TPA: FGLLP motif-containing membrane protein [Candidatus Limnocylindria bacterium]|nr:FGLLP motif-containing membrane protein [Candidatus Limnocylindria bacterium]